MSRGRAPNYQITESHTCHSGPTDTITLPEGSFVRPIELHYVPKHVIEDPQNRYFNKTTEIFCYCHYGILPIPRRIIREAV